MFGKKNVLSVQHYEGLDFAINYPCKIEINNDNFIIKRIKPETTITLPMNQINSFSALPEKDFMLKFHNEAITTSKSGTKYYLVVDYTSKEGEHKHLAFWGTPKEQRTFLDWQKNYSRSGNYSL